MARTGLLTIALIAATLLPAAHALAAGTPGKKVYCWNEGGRKVCGDALPSSAVDAARTEINARSGMATKQVARALTANERATADAQAKSAQQAADVAEAEHRRFMAMVTTFDTEADLRHAFESRVALSHDSIRTAEMGVSGLRDGLVNLLKRASDAELSGRPVPKKTAVDVLAQHGQLLHQQALLAQLRRDADTLSAQLDEAVTRYRELKVSNPGANNAGAGAAIGGTASAG